MKKQKIGVWGLGVVGKSVITFLHNNQIASTVISKEYSLQDIQFLTEKNIAYTHEDTHLKEFLDAHNAIIASPGIDLRPYAQYAHKWITEVDLFYGHTTTPIIAITGTLGKTSLTTLLAQLLQTAQIPLTVGGNIGTGMLDLLQITNAQYTLLELSSFQLEHSKKFSPALAIITNIYPNHLDRHGTLDEYLHAKFNILKNQQIHDQALLPLELYTHAITQFPHRTFSFFSLHAPTNPTPAHTYYFIADGHITKQTPHATTQLIAIDNIPKSSFIVNWLILVAALDMLNLNAKEIITNNTSCTLPDHRVDAPFMRHGIAFYNDSKSTIIESTLAAVNKIAPHKPFLLLGGLSKGVDRAHSLHLFKGKVRQLICFGAEAQTLAGAAQTIDIPASCHATLEEALNAALLLAHTGDHILLSPGGSSFDLFTDYKARGKRFEELINLYDSAQQKF